MAYSPVKRSYARLFLDIRIRSLTEKKGNHLNFAPCGCPMKGCFTGRIPAIDGDTLRDKFLCPSYVSSPCSSVEL